MVKKSHLFILFFIVCSLIFFFFFCVFQKKILDSTILFAFFFLKQKKKDPQRKKVFFVNQKNNHKMTTFQDEYKSTLNAWKGNTPKQQQRRLQVKEAGFWSECAAQPFVPDGAGLISRKAAQQSTALRFPEYDPRSDPHLRQFLGKQEERAIQVRELRMHRAQENRAKREASNSNSPRRGGSAGQPHVRFRRGGKTQASLAKVSKSKPVRVPKPPPNTTQAPAPSLRSLQQSQQRVEKSQQQQRPTSARSDRSITANQNQQSPSQSEKLQLNFVSSICPELKALEDFKKHQEIRDDHRARESHRRAVHQNDLSLSSASYNAPINRPSSSGNAADTNTLHSGGSNTRTICMPVDSDHVLAVKRLFVRSAVHKNGKPCRSEVCAIKDPSENFYVILTREVDLPDIIYMGIAQSNRFRQVAGLPHMTPFPSPDVIFNWLVILGCVDTIDWPSFLIMCTADLVEDFEKVADLKTAYQQFVDKTPLDTGLAYQKVLLYLKSVAASNSSRRQQKSSGTDGTGTLQNQKSFHANAFHEDDEENEEAAARLASYQSRNSTGFSGEGGRTNSPVMGNKSHSSRSCFFQPGDFYGPRHTCSFAEALFCLMPYRIQFHLIKANARGFSVSKNYRGRVAHSGQHDDASGSDHDGQRSQRSSSRSPSNTNNTKPKREKSAESRTSESESGRKREKTEEEKKRAIRFHKFKNAKSRFLEEQSAETRYERKVWL
jgi:hypothetical protein